MNQWTINKADTSDNDILDPVRTVLYIGIRTNY